MPQPLPTYAPTSHTLVQTEADRAATPPQQLTCVICAAPVGTGTAEFAVWVDDAWQGHGVGTLLVRAILRLLAEQDVTTAVGIMEPGNGAIRRLLGRVAPQATTRFEDGMVVVSVPLAERATASGAS